uniref:Potassium channel toxin alpha-KTx 4.2 n=2 Tax=Tityus TaxID=6886 RepID=KAX42_TITSE|nr:RecName: Full=Potassium channel toxin alpha-KTx 4.2; AltName: Full=Neurotoxin Ts-kappa; Short=TsK; Short=TsKappa; AltName: Full=Tityustoxin-9; Short=Ts9; Flags: Precursor [Tityus serrulatus]QPD99048.1 potassium channel toxin Ts9 [Tityus serrulatus]WLF82715.1 putative KTx [Tityus melici]
MKVLYGILIIFILCSMFYLSQEVVIGQRCYRSPDCYSACKKLVGKATGKCTNGRCDC